MRPDAPAVGPHPRPDQLRYADASMDSNPELEPDPIPNIVLHPGDSLAFPHDGGPHASCIRLLDRHGKCYAVLECSTFTDDWIIDTIRFVSATGGRELLPVRPYTDTNLGANSVSFTNPPNTYLGDPPVPQRNLILSHFGRVTPVSYNHTHNHPHTDPADAFLVAYWHDHPHTHDGAIPHGVGYDGDASIHDHDHGGIDPVPVDDRHYPLTDADDPASPGAGAGDAEPDP